MDINSNVPLEVIPYLDSSLNPLWQTHILLLVKVGTTKTTTETKCLSQREEQGLKVSVKATYCGDPVTAEWSGVAWRDLALRMEDNASRNGR
jgi:hypothetical protein